MEERTFSIGASLPSYSFTIERGKIKEFAQAIGDLKDIYLVPEKAVAKGYRDVIAPPTFGTVIDMWGGPGFAGMCESLRINPVKVLHGEQEYTYLGDIVAGDVITATTTLSDYTEKKKMHVLTMETNYVNQRGENILKCRKVTLEIK